MKLVLSVLASMLLVFVSACSTSSNPEPTATPDASPVVRATSTPSVSAPTPTSDPTATPQPATPTVAPTSTSAPTSSTPRPIATPTQPVVTPTPDEDELAQELARVAEIVSEIRGIEWREDVPANIVSLEELQSYLLDILNTEYSEEQSAEDALFMWLLRLIDDPELDLFQMWVDLYQTSTAGLYNSETKEILSLGAGDGLTAYAEVVMAHEYTHALQDQHWGFDMLRPDDLNSEEAFAMLALTEGDAEVVRTLYMLEHMSPQRLQDILLDASDNAEIPDYIPAYILEASMFPYTAGAEFAGRLYREGGFDAINAAYDDPPRSSEQILHPEKYIGPDRDDPIDVDLPDMLGALGDGWRAVDSDVIGEFDLRIMLRENGASNFRGAAAGWGGGRYDYYMNGTEGIVVNRIAWDTPDDLLEFETAFRETLTGMQEAGGIYDDGLGRFHALIELDGTSVFVASNSRDALQRVLAAMVG